MVYYNSFLIYCCTSFRKKSARNNWEILKCNSRKILKYKFNVLPNNDCIAFILLLPGMYMYFRFANGVYSRGWFLFKFLWVNIISAYAGIDVKHRNLSVKYFDNIDVSFEFRVTSRLLIIYLPTQLISLSKDHKQVQLMIKFCYLCRLSIENSVKSDIMFRTVLETIYSIF